MKILFDTNVVLDVLLDRKPHALLAAELFSMVESGKLEGFLGATSVTTVHYLASKTVGGARATAQIENLLALFEVAPIKKSTLLDAVESQFEDYEDAVLHQAAVEVAADGLVTRDRDGFVGAQIPVFSPLELLAAIQVQQQE